VAVSEPLQTILPVNRAHNGTILSVKALWELRRLVIVCLLSG